MLYFEILFFMEMTSEKEKRRVLEEFRSLQQHIAMQQKSSFLQKVSNIKSFGDFKKKFCRKIDWIRRDTSFVMHEWMVSLFYGKDIEPPFVFQISPQDVEKIRIMLDSSKQLNFSSVPEKSKRAPAQMNKELYERVSVDQTWFEIKRNVVYDNFLKEMEPIFRNFLKSPFTVVSLTVWKTRPDLGVSLDSDGNRRGPNILHRDGYPPGHFKCIVYLTPLNDVCGRVQVEGEIIESEIPGCSVIFDQDRLHRSMPGKSEDRYCFEITVMRTLVEVDMLMYYPGAPSSQHLLQAYHAYI